MASIQDLDARQRMINMMYIIFIAMLALNMSKEVLNAFGDINESLENNMEQTTVRNQALMAGLQTKAEEQPDKYKAIHAQAVKIKTTSDDLVSYIDELKKELLESIEPEEDGSLNYEKMDSGWKVNETFFANDKLSDKAKELVAKINDFKKQAGSLADQANLTHIKAEIEKKFNTDPVKNKEGVKEDWMRHNYEGFPLIATLTKFTNIQSDAKQVQSELLSSLVSGQMASDVSMTNYQAIVIPDKTAFFSGENFTGKVVLGRFDNTLNFNKVTINGNEMDKFEGGQVKMDFSAGNVGEHDIKGELQFKEGDSLVKIPVESKYTVISKPNSAVISAEKMNVVYRGVKNPLNISIPGIGAVNASAPGMTHVSGSKYVLDPTSIKAKEVTIKVSGKLPNGTAVSDSKKFRIKGIPSPVGAVRGQIPKGGPIKMQRNGLKISSISAILPDFDFDLKLQVSGFKVQVPGKPIVEVKGTKMSAAAQRTIDAAKRGSQVQIFDIRASIVGNSSYHIPNIYPITVQLTN